MTVKTKTKDSYNWYKEKYKSEISQTIYNKINAELNKAVIDHLLEGNGNKFYFNSRLGFLTIYKFHRKIRLDANGKLIAPPDWGKTNKLRKEGKLDKGKVVYITDSYYIGFKWVKEHCNVKGQNGYSFKSSRTNGVESTSGANNRLRKILKDSLQHFKFPYIGEN